MSSLYKPPFAFMGGTIKQVTIGISGKHEIDHELEAIGMLSRD